MLSPTDASRRCTHDHERGPGIVQRQLWPLAYKIGFALGADSESVNRLLEEGETSAEQVVKSLIAVAELEDAETARALRMVRDEALDGIYRWSKNEIEENSEPVSPSA